MDNFQDKANFIWQVADDILRGAFKQHEYGEVILLFVVLRRLDCVLEDCKDAVIETYKKFKDRKCFFQITTLQRQNEQIVKACELLFPRLMNRGIAV